MFETVVVKKIDLGQRGRGDETMDNRRVVEESNRVLHFNEA